MIPGAVLPERGVTPHSMEGVPPLVSRVGESVDAAVEALTQLAAETAQQVLDDISKSLEEREEPGTPEADMNLRGRIDFAVYDRENMTTEELYNERDRLLRIKEISSDKAWALDLEIERRKIEV